MKLLDFSADRAFAISGFGSRAATAVPMQHEAGSDAGLTAIVVEAERLIPHARNG